MIRMSILRNFPVVLGQRQIGLLQSVSLNEAQNQVLALIVSCGIRGKRVILPESVEAIGKGFGVGDHHIADKAGFLEKPDKKLTGNRWS